MCASHATHARERTLARLCSYTSTRDDDERIRGGEAGEREKLFVPDCTVVLIISNGSRVCLPAQALLLWNNRARSAILSDLRMESVE